MFRIRSQLSTYLANGDTNRRFGGQMTGSENLLLWLPPCQVTLACTSSSAEGHSSC